MAMQEFTGKTRVVIRTRAQLKRLCLTEYKQLFFCGNSTGYDLLTLLKI
jgi:hypothetical protein